MDFNIEDLVSSVEGAVSQVADAVSDAVDYASDVVSNLFGTDSDDSSSTSDWSDDSQSGNDGSSSTDGDYIGDNISCQVTDGAAVTYDSSEGDYSDESSDLETAEAVLGAIPVAANVDEDGKLDDDDDYLEEKHKLLVGAFIPPFGFKESDSSESDWGNDSSVSDLADEGTNIYTPEKAEQYIFSQIDVFGKKFKMGNKIYFSNEISDLPEEISYESNGYTYNYALQEVPINVPFGEPIYGDDIVTNDGQVISTKQYGYVLTDTDQPQVLGGTVFVSPTEGMHISEVEAGQVNKAEQFTNGISNTEDDFVGKLRGEDVTLEGVKPTEIEYVKRDSEQLQTLRNEFNTSKRREFLQNLSNETQYLKDSGFTEKDILKLQDGRLPDGWQVHHKLPLDDSGTNSFDNLVLIKNEPFHKVITNYQNSFAKKLTSGETQVVNWPIPEGNIYPSEH